MSDLTRPVIVRKRRRRITRRTLKRSVRGLRSQLRRTRVLVALVGTLAAGSLGVAAWPDAEPEPIAQAPSPIFLGNGRAGVMDDDTTDAAAVPLAGTPDDAASEDDLSPEASGDEEQGDRIGSGEASYYGSELAGNPTASGEPFNPEGLTAAHRTLPLGSRLRVTNTRNGESVIVRVNDRGPFAPHRVVDVSERAAREIGMLGRGTARVQLELLPRKRG